MTRALDEKNPSEMYGLDYLKSPMGSRDYPVTRWDNNGIFYNTAVTTQKLLQASELPDDVRALDVGCGRGWVVFNLLNLGVEAHGCEYGTEAVEHSVCGAKYGDLTGQLPYGDGFAHILTCHGVLTQLPVQHIPHAIGELARVCAPGGLLWTNLLLKMHELQSHHHTVREPDWWRPLFGDASWIERPDLEGFLSANGFNRSPVQWSAIWERSGDAS